MKSSYINGNINFNTHKQNKLFLNIMVVYFDVNVAVGQGVVQTT